MSKICTIRILDEVNCRISGLLPTDNTFLHEKFAFFKAGYRFTTLFQLRKWDGKIRFYDKQGNTYVKILNEILEYIVNWGYEIDLIDERPPAAPLHIDPITDEFFNNSKRKLRPYQVNAINTMLAEGCGFGILATGAGKTIVCAAMAYSYATRGLPTIIIVPSSDLVTQTIESFRESLANMPIELDIGEYSGSVKQINCPIVVATWQSIQNHPDYMSLFKALIVDESHGVSGEVIRKLINQYGRNIIYRFGVTGTFPKDVVDQYNLKISIGRILCEVPASFLIENGFLSEILIQPIQTQDEDHKLPDYASEKAYLTKHDDRLIAIAAKIIVAKETYGNTFVLVNTIAQGRLLAQIIPDSVFLYGESDKDLRKKTYDMFQNNDDLIVIATAQIASTGLSIDRIFCLFLIDSGKSFVRAIQSIGRGLRKAGDKSKIIVFDLYSRLKFSKKHFKDRVKFYKEASYPTNDPEKYSY